MSDAQYPAGTVRTQADLNAAEALRPILAAGRPQRFRVLRVVCPNQHRLIDVYRTGKGLAFLGDSGNEWNSAKGSRYEPRRRAAIGLLEFPEGRAADVVCRCRSADIPLEWLTAQAGRGVRRVVWGESRAVGAMS